MKGRLPALLATALLVGAMTVSQASRLQPGRPRLYFTAAEVLALRERARTTQAETWDALRSYCDAHVDDRPPATLPGDNYDGKGMWLEANFVSRITNFCFAYVISGDRRYLGAAKRWLLALARMPEWAGKCGNRADADLYSGLGEVALAAGYDWLAAELTAEEGAAVRHKLADIAGRIYEATYGGEWWSGSYWHHDCIIPVAGMGVGALALQGEVPEAERWLARAVEETQKVLNRIGDDGAWHEGVAPWSFGTTAMVLFLDPLKRVTGRSFWWHPWLRQTASYRLYAWLPPARVVNFDDCHNDGGYSSLTKDCAAILYRLARQYRDPYAQWLGDVDAAAKKNPESLVWRFLWRDSALQPQRPDALPLTRLFASQDLVISRAGWGEHDAVVAFTCGSPLGRRGLHFASNPDGSVNAGANTGTDHTHADNLSFLVYADGDYLVSPPGYGRRVASEENCILLDGRGPRRYDDGREPVQSGGKTTLTQESGRDAMLGEAAIAYPTDLGVRAATRQLEFRKPDRIALTDHVEADAPHALEWRFHAGQGVAILPEQQGFRFVGRKAVLLFAITSPAGLQATVEKDARHEWLSLRPAAPLAQADLRVEMRVGRRGGVTQR